MQLAFSIRRNLRAREVNMEYWRSLLRIKAPVMVTLAKNRMPVEQIKQLVPGVMIQFDKACDSPLTVEVDQQPIAEGEVVKVGDKFGLRITNILHRDERFVPLQKQAS